MISPRRLSKIITNRECEKAQIHLMQLYKALSPSQRNELREFINNKSGKKERVLV